MFEKLKNFALLAALGIILCLGIFAAIQGTQLARSKQEAARLGANQTALLTELQQERNAAGQLQSTVQALTLRRDELEAMLPAYERRLREMNVRLKDAQHLAQIATETAAAVTAHPDTVIRYVPGLPVPVVDTSARRYKFFDEWLDAEISVTDTGAALRLHVHDSLTVVAHKERRRCIFRRPRVLYYTAVSANPYTTVTGISYIELTEK